MTAEPRAPGRRARRFVIGRKDDFPAGSTSVVEVNGRSIGVFHYGGRLSALLNRCPHQGGPLCLGVAGPLVDSVEVGELTVDPDRIVVACPWHGWEFDVQTGQSYCDPERFRVKPYPVDVTSGLAVHDAADVANQPVARRKVEGPLKAEVIPISVDDDYVVVQLR